MAFFGVLAPPKLRWEPQGEQCPRGWACFGHSGDPEWGRVAGTTLLFGPGMAGGPISAPHLVAAGTEAHSHATPQPPLSNKGQGVPASSPGLSELPDFPSEKGPLLSPLTGFPYKSPPCIPGLGQAICTQWPLLKGPAGRLSGSEHLTAEDRGARVGAQPASGDENSHSATSFWVRTGRRRAGFMTLGTGTPV